MRDYGIPSKFRNRKLRKKVGTYTYRKHFRYDTGERRGFVNLENRVLVKLRKKHIVEFIEGKRTYRTSATYLRRMGKESKGRTYLPKKLCFIVRV